jgi:hypothetical protein
MDKMELKSEEEGDGRRHEQDGVDPPSLPEMESVSRGY